jgi:peptide/nickel transport system permease protein
MNIREKYKTFFGYKSSSILFVFVLVQVGILSSLIANDKPLLSIQNQEISFPIFSKKIYKPNSANFEIWPPIPYHSQTIDFNNMNSIGPFESQVIDGLYYRHWLGTDELGRDLLAGLIHGCKTAVIVGFGAMLIALIIGISLGGIAGYFKNDKLKIKRADYYILFISISLFLIYTASIIPWDLQNSNLLVNLLLLVGILIGLTFLGKVLSKVFTHFHLLQDKRQIPLDNVIIRLIELLESIPLLFLIISLSAILNPSYSSLMLVIGISSWTRIAKFTRAEVLKIKEQNYIESSIALGLNNSQIIRNHILPNALPAIFISLAFGVASAILAEATLSFLGIGLGAETVSWGSILANSRSDYQSWWLVLFPGILLFFTVYSLNQIGERLSK